MGVKWTEEQKQVIELRNRNILVSAAAGSGKTAVLVERIIQRVIRDPKPIHVNQLLIVTFTEAAAGEMQARILKALEKELKNQPENEHLQLQTTLIHNAFISTIHSFCLSVIRENFHKLNLDPGFRIAEEGELQLLKQDVLQTLLEEEYEKKEETFLHFVESVACGKNDKKIEEVILQVYDFSRSNPQPERWLQESAQTYDLHDFSAFEESQLVAFVKHQVNTMVGILRETLERACSICELPDGPTAYLKTFSQDQVFIEELKNCETLEACYKTLHEHTWARLAPNKDKSISVEIVEEMKQVRESVKKAIKSLKEKYFYEEPKDQFRVLVSAKPIMKEIVRLVILFDLEYAKTKREKNIIDFNDMEHLALQVLTEEVGGKLVASKRAMEYQDQFQEIMIDEYQDSNLIQEAILTSVSKVERGEPNVFMVGDVKQSIYRFRLSRPELFMEKFDTYSLEDGKEQRIDLHKNFRSRREVLDSTNFLFFELMKKQVGGINYDEKAALYLGADFEESEDKKAELLLIEKEGVKGRETKELEAIVVAKRIKELLQQGVKYGEIVILTRSLKGWSDVFSRVLVEEGIPNNVVSREGYFSAQEIVLLLDFLRVLDNPRQDLPLIAVLKSLFGNITDMEFAVIKSEYPKENFVDSVFLYAQDQQDDIADKLSLFLESIACYRKKASYLGIHELLWDIVNETGYERFIYAQKAGEQKKANVEMLIEKATAFEATSYKGLFNFVRYIEQLKKFEVDYGEANVADEQDDVVKIMSVHKSKGLEFPVVFAVGMGKKFNLQDLTSTVVLHPETGIGIDYVDPIERTKSQTLVRNVMKQQLLVDSLGEEMRVLYVAMTRAKEKLILTGTLNKVDETLARLYEREKPMDYLDRVDAKSYLDWILQIACTSKNKVMEIHRIQEGDIVKAEVLEEIGEKITRDFIENIEVNKTYDQKFKDEMEKQFAYTYEYENQRNYKMKFTVSELKKQHEKDPEAEELIQEVEKESYVPEFISKRKEEKGGAFRGSAYHRVMELLDFSIQDLQEEVHTFIAKQLETGRLSNDMYVCIDEKDVVDFLQSDIGKRMCQAEKNKKLYKEQPFVLGISASRIYNEESEEMVLVQGIIDVYFEEDGELVVLDYKTDRVKSMSQLKERYVAQLDYYGEALEQLTGKKVKEKIIYSFELQESMIL